MNNIYISILRENYTNFFIKLVILPFVLWIYNNKFGNSCEKIKLIPKLFDLIVIYYIMFIKVNVSKLFFKLQLAAKN